MINQNFKIGLILVALLVIPLFAYVRFANATFLIVDEHGKLEWQVLSRSSDDDANDKSGSSKSPETPSPKVEEDRDKEGVDEEKKIGEKRKFEVEVRTTNQGRGKATGTEVRIKTEEGRIKLRVATPSGQTEMDVTDLGGDIVRVRERVEDHEIRIRAREDRLEIRQKGIGALTHFPISVNPQTNELTVTTPSGTRVVAVLPSVAVENILQSNIMDRILASRAAPSPSPGETPEPEEEATEEAELEETDEPEQEIELVERDGKLAFKIEGAKSVRFLNFLPVEVPITAHVSAQTGETLAISRPWFLTLFGFLFSQ